MTSENFAYWLNGFIEMNGGQTPTKEQWKTICDHLALVFKKVTPPIPPLESLPVPTVAPPVPVTWPYTSANTYYTLV
jgi:hypothetical protein